MPAHIYGASVIWELDIHQAASLVGRAVGKIIFGRDNLVDQVEFVLQGTVQLFQLTDPFEEFFLPVRGHGYYSSGVSGVQEYPGEGRC